MSGLHVNTIVAASVRAVTMSEGWSTVAIFF